MFDYFTLIFVGIILVCALIGFWRGGFRIISQIIILAIAIVLAVFLSRGIGGWIKGTGFGTWVHDTSYTFLSGSINVEVAPGSVLHGSDTVNAATIDTINAAGAAQTGSADYNVFHEIYAAIHLPSQFYGLLDGLMNDALASFAGADFVVAAPLAIVIQSAICYGLAFLGIFLVSHIVLTIIVGIIYRLVLRNAMRPTLVSRIIGLVGGIVNAFSIIWAVCFVLNCMMLFDNDISNYLKQVLHLTEGDQTWTLAKWFVTTDFGYKNILSFFFR